MVPLSLRRDPHKGAGRIVYQSFIVSVSRF